MLYNHTTRHQSQVAGDFGLTADVGFTADYCDLVTSELHIGPNWYGLSAGQTTAM